MHSIMQGLVNLPSFSLGDCEDEGCNIFWFSSIEPRILLKGRLAPVANGDGSGGIKVMFFLGTLVVAIVGLWPSAFS